MFVAVHLLLTAVRRSAFGDRLLALRESPAACATLGLDPVAARLGVFGFSAALAGLGGGLYAGTLGSITPDFFNLFQSLPLLLTTVAGGVASTGGAVFAAVTLGSIPVVAATFASLAGILGLLPGTMGITLGRNPDGVVADLRHRLAALWPVGPAFARHRRRWRSLLVAGWLADVLSRLVGRRGRVPRAVRRRPGHRRRAARAAAVAPAAEPARRPRPPAARRRHDRGHRRGPRPRRPEGVRA